MIFKDWLAQAGMSDAEFARFSGIGQRALVQKYRHGRQIPSVENLERIRKATNGRVTANDFVAQRVAASPPEPPAAEPPTPSKPKRARGVITPPSPAEAA